MLRWLISLLIIVFILTLAFRYSSFINKNASSRQDESLSLAETGKIIREIKSMNKERKKDIKEKEKQFGGDE